MRLDLLVTADTANIDAAGKFNIIGEFNAIHATELPSPAMSLVVVMRIVAAASEGDAHKFSVVLVDQDGNETARVPDQELNFGKVVPGTSGDLRAQVIIGIQGARFPAYGPYQFQVLVDGRFIGDRTVYVLARGKPDKQAS